VADRILDALRAAGKDGLTRKQIRDIFQRHKSKEEIDRALALLSSMGRVRRESEPTGGRSAERWFLR
jgi:chromosome segregation and condensation protein ScpB